MLLHIMGVICLCFLVQVCWGTCTSEWHSMKGCHASQDVLKIQMLPSSANIPKQCRRTRAIHAAVVKCEFVIKEMRK